ncbi:MAG: biotin/lipoyl-binding protein [Clostridia bacterium]|nr:biotin/lipoyl-binding protein [Clostridia bacterium]
MKYIVTLNNKKYEVEVNESDAVLTSVYDAASVAAPAAPVVAPAAAPQAAPAQATASGEKVVSPMPGTILKVNISQGQAVKAGDVLLVLEAMKMENDIVAPADGVVKQLLVSKGSTVDTDQILAII